MSSPHQLTAIRTAAQAMGERLRAKGAGTMSEERHALLAQAGIRLGEQAKCVKELERRIEDAVSRYWNGQETTLREERQIDWMGVAGQMALALLGEEASQPIAPRDSPREPEDDDGDPETTARMWDGH